MPEPAPPPDDAGSPRRCLNCGAALGGEFCASCGQRDQPRDPTLREMAHEAAEELASFDGRLASTLKALVRPGRLTTEWIAGRRIRYVTPLRLYLTASVLYFFAQSLLPDAPVHVTPRAAVAASSPAMRADSTPRDSATRWRAATARTTPDGGGFQLQVAGEPLFRTGGDDDAAAVVDSEALARERMTPAQRDSADRADSVTLARELATTPSALRRGILHLKRDKKGFAGRLWENVPRLIFLLVPVFAAILALVYRSRRRRYPQHLWLALHLHAFAFVLLAALAGLELAHVPYTGAASEVLLLAGIPVYLVLSLRAVYGGRRRWAIARAGVLLASYLVAVVVGATAMMFLTMLTF